MLSGDFLWWSFITTWISELTVWAAYTYFLCGLNLIHAFLLIALVWIIWFISVKSSSLLSTSIHADDIVISLSEDLLEYSANICTRDIFFVTLNLKLQRWVETFVHIGRVPAVNNYASHKPLFSAKKNACNKWFSSFCFYNHFFPISATRICLNIN